MSSNVCDVFVSSMNISCTKTTSKKYSKFQLINCTDTCNLKLYLVRIGIKVTGKRNVLGTLLIKEKHQEVGLKELSKEGYS